MIRSIAAALFGGAFDPASALNEPLSAELVAELDDETLLTAMLEASAEDQQVMWGEIELRAEGRSCATNTPAAVG